MSTLKRVMMRSILLASVLALLLLACKKEKAEEQDVCFDGVVRWMGEPAADGLGWVLYKDDTAYKQPYVPQNLPDDFKVANQKVSVCLSQTGEKFSCFCAVPLDVYHITTIQRR